jgi:hypothetical protein
MAFSSHLQDRTIRISAHRFCNLQRFSFSQGLNARQAPFARELAEQDTPLKRRLNNAFL